jgi:hypothetical protein
MQIDEETIKTIEHECACRAEADYSALSVIGTILEPQPLGPHHPLSFEEPS